MQIENHDVLELAPIRENMKKNIKSCQIVNFQLN